ncbi:flagellar motor switch protein FliN [Pelagibius litoralis]|uniref:Flagellar motor switch protein FliN n=1 Tax=Pelagibius litoralis TaxID=374515 RepID=A0A967EVP5_9PROT|nr:FliM/FliN family flagellar motor switch protein [Pelagibius litoralis]NIA68976.1 flagellar motor switch protein FliN [Pelagibius litoralis]
MPDDDEEKNAEASADAEGEVDASAEEAGSDDADQEAMMAEWAAMAEEGEEDDAAGGDDGSAAGDDASEMIPSIHEVSLEAYAILGTASMPVSQLLRMGRGAVVELETGLGDEIEMRINDQLVAKGEVVVVEDRIAIEITDIVKREGS